MLVFALYPVLFHEL